MAKNSYSATAFIEQDSEFSLTGVFDQLSGKYRHSEDIGVNFHDQKRLEVDFGNWTIDIAYSTAAPDPEADQQILTNRNPVPAGLDITSCWRLDILSDDPYPCMDHCNDFLIVCERICDSYEGVFVRDNNSGTWF